MVSAPKPKSVYKPLSAGKSFTPARPKPKVSAGGGKKANGYDDGPRPPREAPPRVAQGPRTQSKPLPGPRQPKGPPPTSVLRPAEPAKPPSSRPQPQQTDWTASAKGGSVSWIEGLDSSSVLVQQGFPDSGPVVLHDPEIQEVMSDSANILYELAEDAHEQMSLHHDTDWTQFPEVGEALKAIGIEELALCVALCPGRAKWGVGVAGNQKKRSQAARLSLCLAVASECSTNESVCHSRPCWGEFYSMAEAEMEAGHMAGPRHHAPNGKGRPGQQKGARRPKEPVASAYDTEEDPADSAEAAEESQEFPEEGEEAAVEEEEVPIEAEEEPWEEVETEEVAEPAEHVEPAPKRPRTTATPAAVSKSLAPHWLYIQDMPPSLQGLPQETLSLLAGNWKRKQLLDAAEKALAAALGEEADEVYLEDDADFNKFSSVSDAFKEKSGAEEPITVAISPTQELWAVGAGSQGKQRSAAAMVALATQVALYKAECGEELPDLSKLPAFASFVEEAQGAKE